MGMNIPAEAVEAAAKVMKEKDSPYSYPLPSYMAEARAILEAAAPHMQQEVDLMRWKLDALKEWADAMIEQSNSPQYGRDVKTILEVTSIDEAREIDAL